ncbi:MAG: hypothetical protein IJ667_07165 [Synergistaceae bacterium]|nr:hypothetical protein [Synergistaceae bacterium]
MGQLSKMPSNFSYLLTAVIGVFAVVISGIYDTSLSSAIGGGFLLGVAIIAFLRLFDDKGVDNVSRYVTFSKEQEEELFNILKGFILRVSNPCNTDNTKTPEEVAILPAMIDLYANFF